MVDEVREQLLKLWHMIENAEFDNIDDDDDLVVITVEATQARDIRDALGLKP